MYLWVHTNHHNSNETSSSKGVITAATHEAGPVSISNINTRVLRAEYAVRGEIVKIAKRIEQDLKEGRKDYPFKRVVWCNIGNPHSLGQEPITFIRQVLALCELPQV